MNILIKNGHIVDPVNRINGKMDLLIEQGKVVKVAKSIPFINAKIIDAKGKVVVPGFVDIHTHLRQPGREDKETIQTGSLAAARGGFTSICCMPNTQIVIDNESIIKFVISVAKQEAVINVYPIASAMIGLKQEKLSEMAQLKDTGAVAVSDDGGTIMNTRMMRKVLEYANMLDLVMISHAEDDSLSAEGVMNEGMVSTQLGLRGMPAESEIISVKRNIELAKMTGARIHFAHISTAGAVEAVRMAKKEKIRVTAETCPHYFSLTDEAVKGYSTNTKMNPPLRTKDDVNAVKIGIKDGTIDIIATDHAPHTETDKDVEFDYAPFGIIGLETAFSLSLMELVNKRVISFSQLIEKLSTTPANILDLNAGALSIGADADIAIVDLDKEWVVKKEDFKSKSKNSPFIGWKMKGLVETTICKGKIVYAN